MNMQVLGKSAGQYRGQKQTGCEKALSGSYQFGTTSVRTETCPYPKMLQGDSPITSVSMRAWAMLILNH